MKKHALISVYNKKKLNDIAPTLIKSGYKIFATQGTGKALKQIGIKYTPIDEITKNPKALQDCIQTLSYTIYGGILFNRDNPSHIKEINELKIKSIDIVICNFPPLDETVKKESDFNIHHIDVGGPLMIRAAATNFSWVLVVVNTNDYKKVAKRIKNKNINYKFRKKLAIKAYEYSSSYDAKIVKLLESY